MSVGEGVSGRQCGSICDIVWESACLQACITCSAPLIVAALVVSPRQYDFPQGHADTAIDHLQAIRLLGVLSSLCGAGPAAAAAATDVSCR